MNPMLTESQVRRLAADIHASMTTPARKVRRFLQLGRHLRRQSRELHASSRIAARSHDANGRHVLERMAQRSDQLREEVRTLASLELSGSRP